MYMYAIADNEEGEVVVVKHEKRKRRCSAGSKLPTQPASEENQSDTSAEDTEKAATPDAENSEDRTNAQKDTKQPGPKKRSRPLGPDGQPIKKKRGRPAKTSKHLPEKDILV